MKTTTFVFILMGLLGLTTGCTGGGASPSAQTGAKTCTAAGGTETTVTACISVGDYEGNYCAIGASGCAPAMSHQAKTCACGTGKCWDGTSCKALAPVSTCTAKGSCLPVVPDAACCAGTTATDDATCTAGGIVGVQAKRCS